MGRCTAVLVLVCLSGAACRPAGPDRGAAELARGQDLYGQHGCGTCHGLTGRGDGPVGKTLSPPPRDFRDAEAFKNGTDPSSIANTLATGLTRDGGQMQSYFHLSDHERYLIARYVISLRESTTPGATP